MMAEEATAPAPADDAAIIREEARIMVAAAHHHDAVNGYNPRLDVYTHLRGWELGMLQMRRGRPYDENSANPADRPPRASWDKTRR